MGVKFNHIRALIVCLFVTGVLVTSVAPLSSFGQLNSTSSIPNSSPDLPKRGLYYLLYTESGGLKPIRDFYVFDITDGRLSFVDLDNNTTRSKALDNSSLDKLNTFFYQGNLPENLTHIKSTPCPDCRQYGLSLYFVDLEIPKVASAYNAFWDDSIKDIGRLGDLVKLIKSLGE